MANRDKIIDRVRALLAKTVENGCTEAEALAAAETAARLMEEYEVSRDDVDSVKDDRYGIRTIDNLASKGNRMHPAQYCLQAIARFCNVRVWRSGSQIKLFGSEADTEFAKYLTTIVQIAMEREVAAYLRGPDRPAGVHGASLRASFLHGMAHRVSGRLNELSRQRTQRMQSTEKGTALVVVKDQEVARRFSQLGMKLKSGGSRTTTVRSGNAYQAGQRAGDRVSFGKPIGGSTRALTH